MLGKLDKLTGDIKKTNIVTADENGTVLRRYVQQNYVIHNYGENRLELCYYPEGFTIAEDIYTDKNFCTDISEYIELDDERKPRKWKEIDGILTPVDDSATLSSLMKTLRNGSQRSVKNFYSYAFSNKWEYFFSFTFAPDKIDRFNKKAINAAWSEFRIKTQRKYDKEKKDLVKMLCVPEEHENGAYHLHGLMSGCDLILTPGRNKKDDNKFYYSKCGNQVFNLMDWELGWSTVCCINPVDNLLQVANYVSKYVGKQMCSEYNGKRYFHTYNLNCSLTVNGYIEDLAKFIFKTDFLPYKTTKNCKIFRNFDR